MIWRYTGLVDSGRLQHTDTSHGILTSPLSEERHISSHPAENDKYSNLALFSILIFCRLELQLSLVAMVFAHSETGSSVGRRRTECIKLNHYQLSENGPFGSIMHNKTDVGSFSSFIRGVVMLITQEDK